MIKNKLVMSVSMLVWKPIRELFQDSTFDYIISGCAKIDMCIYL